MGIAKGGPFTSRATYIELSDSVRSTCETEGQPGEGAVLGRTARRVDLGSIGCFPLHHAASGPDPEPSLWNRFLSSPEGEAKR